MANLVFSDGLNPAVDKTDTFNPAYCFLNSSNYSYVQAKTSGLNANLIHIIDYFKPRDFGLSNDQYARFEGVEPPIKRIGEPSNNGFINLIQYKRGGYVTYAVLKSSTRPNADNLMYEYMVGQYVNKLNKRFPCFVETYGYYKYKNKQIWEDFKVNKDEYEVSALKLGLELQDKIDYAVACENSDQLAILIQYLPNITAIYWKLLNEDFLQKELANVLFQIYMPLSVLAGSFTHHDLHAGNVNVCEPAEDSYIQFHYHMDDGTELLFKSKYIAKMIDYGRSYFNDEEAGIDSTKIYKEICAEPKCKPDCGEGKGFFNSQNRLIDVRLLEDVRKVTLENHKHEYLPEQLKFLLRNLDYDEWLKTSRIDVRVAALALKNIISDPVVIASNDAEYVGKKKLGNLHIYCTGPDLKGMQFMEEDGMSFDNRESREQSFERQKLEDIIPPVPKKRKKPSQEGWTFLFGF